MLKLLTDTCRVVPSRPSKQVSRPPCTALWAPSGARYLDRPPSLKRRSCVGRVHNPTLPAPLSTSCLASSPHHHHCLALWHCQVLADRIESCESLLGCYPVPSSRLLLLHILALGLSSFLLLAPSLAAAASSSSSPLFGTPAHLIFFSPRTTSPLRLRSIFSSASRSPLSLPSPPRPVCSVSSHCPPHPSPPPPPPPSHLQCVCAATLPSKTDLECSQPFVSRVDPKSPPIWSAVDLARTFASDQVSRFTAPLLLSLYHLACCNTSKHPLQPNFTRHCLGVFLVIRRLKSDLFCFFKTSRPPSRPSARSVSSLPRTPTVSRLGDHANPSCTSSSSSFSSSSSSTSLLFLFAASRLRPFHANLSFRRLSRRFPSVHCLRCALSKAFLPRFFSLCLSLETPATAVDLHALPPPLAADNKVRNSSTSIRHQRLTLLC